jgi:hypothetical protein
MIINILNEEGHLSEVAVSKEGTAFYQLETSVIPELVDKWAWDYFEQRCSCSYDCCGHWNTSAIWVYPKWLANAENGTDSNMYIIEVNAGRNC